MGVRIDSKILQRLEHFMKIVFRLYSRVNILFNIDVEFVECHFKSFLVLLTIIPLANRNVLDSWKPFSFIVSIVFDSIYFDEICSMLFCFMYIRRQRQYM